VYPRNIGTCAREGCFQLAMKNNDMKVGSKIIYNSAPSILSIRKSQSITKILSLYVNISYSHYKWWAYSRYWGTCRKASVGSSKPTNEHKNFTNYCSDED